MNRFKLVNDRYGHACGDLLLQQVAQRIAACLRSSDTLARLGGDEFVVLLEDMALPEDAQSVLEKIHLALSAPVELGGAGLLQISVSVGVAHYPGDGNNWQTLMSHADAAMYAAKATAALGDAVT